MYNSKTIRSLVVSMVILIGIVLTWTKLAGDNVDSDYGETLVRTLYEFQTYAELDSKMDVLKNIVTDDVYKQLTIDSTERALRVYLKFKGGPSLVKVEEKGKGFIVYRLETDSLSSERLFLLKYEIDRGKVSKVFEAELLPFVGNDFNND